MNPGMTPTAPPTTGNPRVDELMQASDAGALSTPAHPMGVETAAIKLRKALQALRAETAETNAMKTCVENLVGEALDRIENGADLIDAIAECRTLFAELRQARRVIERQKDELRKAIQISRAPWPKGMVLRDSRNPARRDSIIVTLSDGSVWEGVQLAESQVAGAVEWRELSPVPTTRAFTRAEFARQAKAASSEASS
jgi:hypothetical protein